MSVKPLFSLLLANYNNAACNIIFIPNMLHLYRHHNNSIFRGSSLVMATLNRKNKVNLNDK
jgi:hypothetical protein